MKFKRFGISCLIVMSICFGMNSLHIGAQTSAATRKQPAETPEATARSFYAWYMHELNQEHDPLGKPSPTFKKYVTARLIKEIDRMVKGPDGLDGDYFIDAQDWDKDWERNITVAVQKTEGPKSVLHVTLSGPLMTRNVRVTMLQQQGTWKVDKVEGLDH